METLVHTYLRLWNETDADRRAALFAETFAEEASYQDPHMQATGSDGIDRLIQAVHSRFPEFAFTSSGDVETVGDHVRFSWNLGPRGGDPIANGTDFARIVDGRFTDVVGFLNPIQEILKGEAI